MSSFGIAEFTRSIAAESLEQAECIAAKLGYYLAEERQGEDGVHVTFQLGRARPKLTLVHSKQDSPQLEAATP